jgi:Winged helix-turn helix
MQEIQGKLLYWDEVYLRPSPGGCPMRGRKPRPLKIAAADVPRLQSIARRRSLPWLQVQHARMLLAVGAGQRTQTVARQLQGHEATVWRLCRRYEQGGLAALLRDAPRSGRPQQISPPAAGSNRRMGLSGAHGQGGAHHALVEPGFGAGRGRRRPWCGHQPPHDSPDLAGGGPATAAHAVLEDCPRG